MEQKLERNYEGLKVLDFSRVQAGPYVTMLLRDNGAEVVKIERPYIGADEYVLPPFIENEKGKRSVYYMMMNRGKKSVALDMKDPECKEIIFRLIQWADVLVENFAAGVMDRLGYGYEVAKKLNPRLIYCSISTFGQEGPLARQPGYDIVAQAMSGLMWMTGDPNGSPVKSGTTIGDDVGGLTALSAIGAALYYRARTGKGQFIDIALRDTLSAILETSVIRYTSTHGAEDPIRTGDHHPTMGPYGVFNAGRGRYIVIAALMDKQWASLCKAMGKEAWGKQPQFGSISDRGGQGKQEMIRGVEEWLQSFEDYREPLRILQENRVGCCPVMSIGDLLSDPQYRMRDTIVEVDDPIAGRVELPATPMKFSETSVYNPLRAPLLGENTAEVLEEIAGCDRETVDRLVAKYVTGQG